ncbi:hypothetical protein MPER_06977 [Moniliophthora perniciosa FA553]|nr:hypothetical protein MPER_06977 [Moniliophthora perniciosa FA553]
MSFPDDIKAESDIIKYPSADSGSDVSVQFDAKAEARLRRKIDLYIIPTVSILYLFCFIDRANIGNARLAGFESDLGLKGYDYNSVLSIFFISYIIFEIPSNMACKYFGPGWYLPAILAGDPEFCPICTPECFEAGMLPGKTVYMAKG